MEKKYRAIQDFFKNQDESQINTLGFYLQELEKEVQRKDKALAEAAALLVLSKKANAIWGEPEVG